MDVVELPQSPSLRERHNDAAPLGMREVQRIASEEQRTIPHVCEMLLCEGGQAYKKEGPNFTQHKQ